MNNFPEETLVLIFKYLHLKQKLECMLVCRAWAKVLLQGYLFETVQFSFSDSHQSFDRHLISLIKKAKSEPYPGKKCKRFLIDSKRHGTINVASLASAFPNLNFFYSRFNIIYKPEDRSLRSTEFGPDPFLGWRINLETFIDEGFDVVSATRVLKTGVFSNLTTLKLRPTYSEDEHFPSVLISLLKNTPALTNLSINIDTFSLLHLEELHKSAPELTSLTLEGDLLDNDDIDDDKVLLNVVPAEKVKVLRLIKRSWIYSDSDSISSYIKLKYTRLNEFSCNSGDQTTWVEISNIFSDSKLAEFITIIGPGLTKCVVSLIEKSTETVTLIEKYMPQLESLGIDIFGCKDLFGKAKMDQAIQEGHQLLNLRRIEFKKFIQLKELSLDFSDSTLWIRGYYKMSFGELLNRLPKTIRTLCLRKADITVDQEEKESTQNHLNIVNLKLYGVNISEGKKGFSVFLSQNFPKLQSLVLNDCNLKYNIELPDHHLHYFEYAPDFVPEDLNHFKITMPDKTLYYEVPTAYRGMQYLASKRAMGNRDRTIQRVLKSSPNSGNTRCHFHFKCASVQTVYSCNYHLLL